MTAYPANPRVVDPVLTTHSRGYRHPERVGSLLFPAVPVDLRAGKVLQFGKESFMLYSARRAPGANTKRVEFGYEGEPFALVQDRLEGKVPLEYQQEAASAGVDMGPRAVNNVMQSLTLALEHEQATLATTAANYDSDHKVTLSGSSQWSHADSDPIGDIEEARQAIRASCGFYPNAMVLGPKPYGALKNNPKITARFRNSDLITAALLAGLFEIKTVVEGKAVTSTDAGEFEDVWGNYAVLAYVPEEPAGMEQPSYGYTYTMRGNPFVDPPYWDGNTRSNIYGVTYERAPVLTGVSAGFLFTNPAATS